MAKRKSLNKRRSRYSSAILNSDTDIFGDEYPYWWKRLEDTSLAQLSTDSKILNETSRHLDSNSQIETSQVTGEWWKILDASSIPNSPKINKDIVKKNSANNALMSESEEELEIAKSKHHLRSKTRKSKDNIFLNVLKDSVTTKSDVKTENNNVITSESEEEPEIAKKRYHLLSKAKQSKDNIFLNVLDDSMTTTSEVTQKNNNVVTSESEGEPEIVKRKFPLRSKAVESKHNVSSNILNDFIITKSDVKKKNNNVVTSESEEGSKIAKKKNRLHLREKRSKGNVFLHVLNDSMTTRSEVMKRNSNIVTSASEEEPEIAKSKHHLRSKARESKDNIFLNVLNDSATTKSDVKNKSNDIIMSESDEEPKIAKKRYPLHSKEKQNRDNIFLNFLDDSMTTTSEVTQKNNNVVTSESEGEPEIAKRKFPLRSKAIESKDNIFSNLLNDSVRSKSGTIHETNNVPILESEESKNAKVNYSLRSLATKSKDNIASNILNDSVTTTSGIAQKTSNTLTLESEEPKSAKGKHLSRSKVTESKDNIASNILNDSVTTTSGIAQKTNNTLTLESEEPKSVKGKHLSRSKVTESKDNIASDILNDSVTTTSGIAQKTSNTLTLESEERKSAKGKHLSRSKVTESKDNIASNILNDSVTTTLGIAQKTNNILTLESEEPKSAKRKHLSRSKVTESKDNIFSNVLDDSATAKLEVMQKTGEKSSKSNSASNSGTVANVEQLNKIQGYSLNHSQKTDDILKSKSNISKNKNNELQMTTNYLVPAITETSVSSETESNRFVLNFEDDSIHFAIPKAQSTILEGNNLSIHNSTKESDNSDACRKTLKWKSKLLTNHNKNAKKNLFETVLEDQESTIKIGGNATADGIAEHSLKSSKVSEALHLSRLSSSPTKKAISSPSRHSTMVKTCTNARSDEPKGQTSIRHFLMSDKTLPTSQKFWDKEKVDGIKRKLERVKEREIARMKMDRNKQEVQKKLPSREEKIKEIEKKTKSTSQKQRPIKQVHKAFLVNGRAYRAPRLPRPQHWITDRLYKYLWKCMEPRYKLETRVVSEKFIHQLSSVTTLIAKRKSYSNYKAELYALMKEMARLDIIRTRNDFYNFCHDFFPYELRVKTVPMLLPGNKRNIPYDADKLHKPLLVP
ncbi:putative uncharacterized protein DDB_G0282499 [Bombus pascuorum]|uniref:putative uncharacterized protein DDB_G0282499 n=1 Tax=Bombus pascuorum TaxID=65598 RepID=UPI00298E3C6F|nr:putative uncharacterized protein DDB_G0282499 [Bombus pascuorum]